MEATNCRASLTLRNLNDKTVLVTYTYANGLSQSTVCNRGSDVHRHARILAMLDNAIVREF